MTDPANPENNEESTVESDQLGETTAPSTSEEPAKPNDEPAKPNDERAKPNDEPAKPTVISRDGDIWVIHKPSGYAVHPTGDDSDMDLVTWMNQSFPSEGVFAPAHRLDRATSGVVLLSPDPDVRGMLGGWFKEGLIRKEYRALVFGHIHKRGTIRRKLKDPRRGKSLAAVSRYWKLEDLFRCSLVKVVPETGRRHQIRRHLCGIGHAIIGDDRYKPRKFHPVPGFPGRLWLHAQRLDLPDGRILTAPLPPELKRSLEILRQVDEGDP